MSNRSATKSNGDARLPKTEHPCPEWCSLPAGHAFKRVGHAVSVRVHVRPVFENDPDFLILTRTEVRVHDFAPSLTPEVWFHKGRIVEDAAMRQIGLACTELIDRLAGA